MKNKIIGLILIIISILITSNVYALKNACFTENRYYYFIYQLGSEFECYKIVDNQKVQVACNDNDISIKKTTKDNALENVNNNLKRTHNAVFTKELLPKDYNVTSVQTEPKTNFTKEDFYIVFDTFMKQKEDLDTKDKYIYKEQSGNRIVYHHVYGDLNEEPHFLTTIKPYYDSLSDEEKLKYRDEIVNMMFNSQLDGSAYVGTKNNDTFNILTPNNLNDIYLKEKSPAIQVIIDKNNLESKEPFYYNNNGNMRSVSYIIPIKVEVEIESNCKERTCEDVNKEYQGCINSKTCNENLIKEYEECNPLVQVNNPKTADLNKVLVVLIIIGAIVIFITTYQENKKNRHSI